MLERIVSVIVFVIVVFCGWGAYKVWTLGNDQSDYNIVCLGGHEYYRANFAAKGLLGIKLSDNGKPYKCE